MNTLDQLRTHPWFAKLTLEQFAALFAIARREVFAPAQSLARQGDLGNRFFVIESGTVNLRHTDANGMESHAGLIPSPQQPDATMPPINYFGEQMFTTQEPYEFHASALTETVALTITRTDFDSFCQSNPTVLEALTFVRDAEKQRTRGFSWVAPGERVAVVARKHWWALLPPLMPVLAVNLAVFIIDLLVNAFLKFDIPVWVSLLVLGGGVAWLAWTVYEWFNDEYVVTTQRVVHIERVMIFNESRKGAPLDKILNVRVDLAIPSAWFGVGTLVIQTAGREEGDVTFANVSNPQQIRAEIETQKSRIRARQAAEEREKFRERIRSELVDLVAPDLAKEKASTPNPAPVGKPRGGIRPFIRDFVRSMLSLEVYTAERVVWRKHWYLLFKKTRWWIAALVFLDLYFLSYALNPTTRILTSGAFLLGGLVTFLILFGGLVWNWIDWKNDIYAVTTSQVIDEERLPFNLKTISNAAPLDQVQDVRLDIPGPIAAWLNYGNVIVETAGKGGQMVFEMVQNPRHVQEEIFRRIEAAKKRRIEQEATLRNRSVIDALVAYHGLQQQQVAASKKDSPPSSEASSETKPADDSIPPSQPKPGG